MNPINTDYLKAKIDVTQLFTHYKFEKVTDAGEWVKSLCPYHDDSNPSFCMRKSDTRFHCWSCPAKGDAIQLVMDLENIDFNTAVNKLAGICGYVTNEDSKMEYIRSRFLGNDDAPEEKEEVLLYNPRLHDLNKKAAEYFKNALPSSIAEMYLVNRNFHSDTVAPFCLGYYKEDFINWAITQGFTQEELILAGFLTIYGERFSERLMFPIYDNQGNIVAFSGRALLEQQEPKYTATQNSDFYKKGFFLYGLQNVKRKEPIVLVEGNLDCIRLSINGINCVAQLGTALTKNQCKLLKSLTDEVILLYDGDEAGQKTSYSSIIPLMEAGLYVKIALVPPGDDPDTYVVHGGAESLKVDIIEKAVKAVKTYLGSPLSAGKGISSLLVDCLRAVNKIEDQVVRDLYVKDLSEAFGLSEKSILAELKKV